MQFDVLVMMLAVLVRAGWSWLLGPGGVGVGGGVGVEAGEVGGGPTGTKLALPACCAPSGLAPTS